MELSFGVRGENRWGKGGERRREREGDKGGRWGLCEGVKEKNLLDNG